MVFDSNKEQQANKGIIFVYKKLKLKQPSGRLIAILISTAWHDNYSHSDAQNSSAIWMYFKFLRIVTVAKQVFDREQLVVPEVENCCC